MFVLADFFFRNRRVSFSPRNHRQNRQTNLEYRRHNYRCLLHRHHITTSFGKYLADEFSKDYKEYSVSTKSPVVMLIIMSFFFEETAFYPLSANDQLSRHENLTFL